MHTEAIKEEDYSLALSKYDLETILSKMKDDRDIIIITTKYNDYHSYSEFKCSLHSVNEEMWKLHMEEQKAIDIKQEAQNKLAKLLKKAREEDDKIQSEDIRRKQYLALKAEFEGYK
jgi:transcriptional/translational regulatory protein YebC/TACO1